MTEQLELERAKNFIKYLLHGAGGSIQMMFDPKFNPDEFEIVRESIVGEIVELISLKPAEDNKE